MDVGYGSFNKQAAGLKGVEGRIWTFIHHDGSHSHGLGLGQNTQKLAGNSTGGLRCSKQKFLGFTDCIVLSHSILPSRHSTECSYGQRNPLVSMVRQIMLFQCFVALFLRRVELK